MSGAATSADSGAQAALVGALFAAVVALTGLMVAVTPEPTAAEAVEGEAEPEPAPAPESATPSAELSARDEAIARAAETRPAELLGRPVAGLLGRQVANAPPLPASMRSHEVDGAASKYDDLLGYDGRVFKRVAGRPLLVEGRKTPRALSPPGRDAQAPPPARRRSPSGVARPERPADSPATASPSQDVPPVGKAAAAVATTPAPAEQEAEEAPAVALEGESVKETLGRAQRSLNRGDPRGAVQAYRQALAGDPGSLAARYGLAKARYAMNDVARARQELGGVLKASPQHSGALLMMAIILRETGDRGGAKTQYERYLSAHPEGRHAGEVKRMLAQL